MTQTQAYEFVPSWTETGTAAQAEKDFGNGFKFKGPGWYHDHKGNSKQTMLVIPMERPANETWHQKWTETELFRFCMWDGPNPADAFNLIINAPTRE